MTRDDAVKELQEYHAFRRTGIDLMQAALIRAQNALEQPGKTLPWFLRKQEQTLSTLPGEEYILLPADFIKEVDEAGLRTEPGTASSSVRWLDKADERTLRNYYASSSPAILEGGPRAYTLLPTQLRIYPLPNKIYTLYWDYYGKALELNANITNLWLTHNPDILIGLAGARLARRYRDAEAERTFTGLFNDGQRQLISDNIEREWANRDYIMGRKR